MYAGQRQQSRQKAETQQSPEKRSPLPPQMLTVVSPQASGGLADCGLLYSVGPRETSLLGTQEGT